MKAIFISLFWIGVSAISWLMAVFTIAIVLKLTWIIGNYGWSLI